MSDPGDRLALADRVVAHVGDRAEVEATVLGGTTSLTRFANSSIHQNVGEEGETLTVRLAVDGRVVSATTTRVEGETLGRFVDEAIARTAHQPPDPDWPGLAEPAPVEPLDHHDPATASATPAERADRVGEFVAAGDGLAAAGYCETTGTEIAFANSKGVRLRGRSSQAILDGIHQGDISAGSGHAASVRLADIDATAVGERAARRARESAGAGEVEPGRYEVVLAPECVATIAVFLGFYGFNAKMHQEGQSFAELGGHQFDARVELVDDVTDPRAIGIGFDTEGTPRRPLTLVTGGVTTALAHDRRTAAKAGEVSTGHGMPGSEVYGPVPSSLFLRGGGVAVDDLVGGVERGLYVATFNYCRVLDPKTLVVTGLTRNGTFLVEGGRIVRPVEGMRFTQSFVDALGPGNVLAVGDDERFADSEFGPGMAHVPSLRLGSWNFTGGAAG